jgi:medium-chain acyl-[acyl-carrier-protein] hydrolase
MNAELRTPWVVRPRPNEAASVRLFCIPYAGGGPQVFQEWPSYLPADVEVIAVSLPGRGRRFSEQAQSRLHPLADALAAALVPFMDRPFALFGHSMGAYLAYETVRQLSTRYSADPVHLFVSGAAAPQIPNINQFHALPDERFVEMLRSLNGLETEVLGNAEILDLLLPVIRADFAVAETYTCDDETPINCPISVLAGSNDWLVPVQQLERWAELTKGRCTVDVLDGDHFFLRSERAALLRLIAARLEAGQAA